MVLKDLNDVTRYLRMMDIKDHPFVVEKHEYLQIKEIFKIHYPLLDEKTLMTFRGRKIRIRNTYSDE